MNRNDVADGLRFDELSKNVIPAVGGGAKRALDLTLALAALVLLAPTLILIALLIRMYDGGPAFFQHTRVGLNGRAFGCLKFRTMRTDPDEALAHVLRSDPAAREEWIATRKLKADPRVTPLGRVLRKTSVDELPQLINVIRGDMSVIGPRPIVRDELPLYGPHAADYLRARPGLTGAWQVSGRNDVSYDSRVRLDGEYVNSWSFRRDLVILLLTIPAVLRARGSY